MFNKKLELFKRNKNSIWTDKYISKELLKCHLDEFTDGASRKLAKRNKILKFINNNIPKRSKILDLGCGPGLLDFKLAKLGHKVLGIDFNLESINYALKNKKSKNIEYRYENYLESVFNEKYNAILMIYCDFGALIPNEQSILLKNVYDALEDNGVFIFDVFTTDLKATRKPITNWNIYNNSDFWCENPHFLLQETQIFEKANAIGERYFVIDQKENTTKEFILWNQYYSKNGIGKVLSENKFKINSINEDLMKDENSMFIISQKASNSILKQFN